MGVIKAVSFDLWDTLVYDDSDEVKRRAKGLRSKREERRHLVWAALERHQTIDKAAIDLAYDTADAAFDKVWHEQYVTWTIGERLGVLLHGLGRSLPAAEFEALASAHADMEVAIPPDPVDGIEATLQVLRENYKLCVVSDTIVSPGQALRRLLEGHGLARYFDGFAFSDEVGHSKPHADMFLEATRQLEVEAAEMVHIGDRDHNDIKGAHAMGMKAILFTGSRANDHAITAADAVIESMAELPAAIEQLR